MFANDTVLVCAGMNLNDHIFLVKNRPDTTTDWCKANKLLHKSKKRKYVLVTNRYVLLRSIFFIYLHSDKKRFPKFSVSG